MNNYSIWIKNFLLHLILFLFTELSSQSDNFHPDRHLSSGRPSSPARIISHGAPSSVGIPHSAGRSEDELRRLLMMTRYDFPPHSGLLTKVASGAFIPIGNIEYPVLISGTGFVVAVDARSAVVRGIYSRNRRRVKINVNSGEIVNLQSEEQRLYPVDRMYNVPSTLVLRGTYNSQPSRD